MSHAKAITIVYFCIFASLFAFITPVFEAPDETHHLDYINYVASTKSLPNQLIKGKSVYFEGHQHPLYYLLAGGGVRLIAPAHKMRINRVHNKCNQGIKSANMPAYVNITDRIFKSHGDMWAFYILRLLSVALAALNLVFIWRIGELFFKNEKLALVPVVFAATLPQFLFISGVINNDNLTNLLCTMCIYFCLSLLRAPDRLSRYIWLGLTLGLALLAKKTALCLVPGVIFMLCYLTFSRRDLALKIARYTGSMLVITLAICGWWFIRNRMLYGEFLGTQMEKETVKCLVDEKSIWSPFFLRAFPLTMLWTFIGCFGFCSVHLPRFVQLAYRALFAISGLGMLINLIVERVRNIKVDAAILFILSCLAAVVFYNLSFTQPQGRFMFPVISLIGVLITVGLRQVASVTYNPRIRSMAVYGLIIMLIVIDIISLVTEHRFYYRLEQYPML